MLVGSARRSLWVQHLRAELLLSWQLTFAAGIIVSSRWRTVEGNLDGPERTMSHSTHPCSPGSWQLFRFVVPLFL